MATLERLRNRSGILITVVIGLALFAFILQDFIGGGGASDGSDIEIAKIGGKSVSYQFYQSKMDHLINLNKALTGQGSVDEQTAEQIKEEVWTDIVREQILGKGIEDLGIVISSDELFDMVQGVNIHPFIRQQFGNRQTGEFDRNFMIQFLKNKDNDPSGLQNSYWLYMEDLIQKDRIGAKYNNLVKKGMFVTSLQAKRSAADRSRKVDFDFIMKRYTTIEDSTIVVTEKELKAYYEKLKNEYEQKASRDIEYVLFPIDPSTDDYQLAEKWIKEIAPDFAAATDAGQFANLNSDIPFNSKYLNQSEISNPELAKWAFNAKVGEMFGPAFDGDSYLLSRITEIVTLSDSVKARHILLATNGQPADSSIKLKNKADSIMRVLKRGESFARLASRFSDDPGSASKGGDLGWFGEGIMVKPFNDACFNGKKGDITLVESQFGFHIIEILDKSKPSKKVQLANLERKVIPSTRTYQQVFAQASEFAGMNNTFEKFNEALQANRKLVKRSAPNLKPSDRKIAGLENPIEMIRWAYNAKKHQVSSAFEIGQNFVVAVLTEVREDGFAPLAQIENDIKAKLIRDKKAEMLIAEMNGKLAPDKNLEVVGQELGVTVQNASRVSFATFSLPAAGFEPVVIASSLQAKEGKLSGPIKGNSGVFALIVTSTNIEEVDEIGEKNRIIGGYVSRATYEPFEALKKRAKIVDKRAKYF